LRFADCDLGVEEMIEQVCREFFAVRLPLLRPGDLTIQLNLSTASSPGRVNSSAVAGGGFRHRWFEPRGLQDLPERQRLFANDTSFGTGYAPRSASERLARRLTEYLSARPSTEAPCWLGTDVKVMVCQVDSRVDIVACVPQIADHVASRAAYLRHLEQLNDTVRAWLRREFPEIESTLRLNTRDKPDTDELYLTAIGSSIESGDEGLVGRGNRANGLITPMRPMNLEGVNGKNPVYHVGKLYNVLATRIADTLHEAFGGAVAVNLISVTGSSLDRPWRAVIQMESPEADLTAVQSELEPLYASLPCLTAEIVAGRVSLS
jgi:S-adenosylmethionine synthetase